MRKTSTVAAVVLAATVAIACSSGGGDDTAAGDADDSSADEVTADVGTRDNPLPAGDEFELDDWTLTLAETNVDATETILEENEFNEVEGGHTAVMVEVTAVYNGEDAGTAWLDLMFAWVSEGGNTYDAIDAGCGVVPDDLIEAGDQYEGASETGNVCFVVPDEDIEGGLWRIGGVFGDDEIFVDVT